MTELKNILLLEYLNLSETQKKFYFPSPSDRDIRDLKDLKENSLKELSAKDTQEEDIESRFFYSPKKISWSSNIQLPFVMQREGFNYVYMADNNFHLLLWTCLIWKLPKVSIRDEYKGRVQISWIKNLGISIIKEAGLYFGDKKLQYMDMYWYCIYHKFLLRDPEKKRIFSKMIGNRKSLIEWSDTLEQNTIIVPQPWYYSQNEVHAFPLFLCKNKFLKHKYNFRDRIQELLRMRVLQSNQEWKELSEINLSYLEFEQDILSPPEMIGKYIQLSEEEYEYRKDTRIVYYLNDIVKLTEETPKRGSEFISLDVNIPDPCQAIFFIGENLNNTKIRKYTEFNTSSNESPFSTFKMIYGTTEKILERDLKTIEYLESFYHFTVVSKNLYKGCHGIILCYDIFSPDPDTSIVFKNLSAKILIRLKDNVEELYKIRFYFYILKRIDIEKDNCIIYSDLLQVQSLINK